MPVGVCEEKAWGRTRPDVDSDGGIAALAGVVEIAAQPAVAEILVLVAGCLPDFRGAKVTAVGVGIAHAADHGEMTGIVEILKASQVWVETERIVQRQHLVRGNPNGGTGLVIEIIGVGHDSIKAVIAARELNQHENGAILARRDLGKRAISLGMQGRERLRDKTGHGPTKCAAQKRGAEEVAAGGEERVVHRMSLG